VEIGGNEVGRGEGGRSWRSKSGWETSGAATSRVESSANTDYKGPAVAPGYQGWTSGYELGEKVSGGGLRTPLWR
jgi:hypothetical protein